MKKFRNIIKTNQTSSNLVRKLFEGFTPQDQVQIQSKIKRPSHKKMNFIGVVLVLTLTILGTYPLISASRAAQIFTGSTAPQVLAGSDVAQESINLDDVKSGKLMMRTDEGISSAILLSTDVKIDIAGPVSRTIVSQRFINTGEKWAEGVYVFPIGENSAVDTLKMRIGDRFIEGKIKEKKVAKIAYEKAKEEGKKASLVEQQKPNMFTNTIANIGPGEIVTVQIEFQTKLSPHNGVWELRVPLVSAPKYSLKTFLQKVNISNFGFSEKAINAEFNDNSDVTLSDPSEIINPVEISINLKPGFEIGELESPYHDVDFQNIADGHKSIQTKGPISSDRDFVLTWRAKDSDVTASLFTEKQHNRDHYLLTLNPPLEIKNQKPTKREIIFVVDISGSMSGEPLRQAKAGLVMAIKRLKSNDKFNIVFFSDTTWSYTDTPVQATPLEKRRALGVVQRLETEGGTIMYPALNYALDNFTKSTSDLKQLIFLTDGQITNEDSLFEVISRKLDNTRLFTIGIGSAPNSYFMSRSAEIGRGAHLHIGKESEISAKMSELFAKIENPAVTDLKLKLPNGLYAEHYPNPLPDLYVGDPVSIAIRGYESFGTATLEGKIGDKNWSIDVPLDQAVKHSGIAKVWAREKIANLERAWIAQSASGETLESIDRELLKTALNYGLVSRLSSLVALDVTPTRPLQVSLTTSKIKTAIPHGWDRRQFEFSYEDVLPPSLQKSDLPFAKIYKASLANKSTTYALPKSALNWKLSVMLAMAALFFGLTLLWVSRQTSNA